jgi:hypothetical protein
MDYVTIGNIYKVVKIDGFGFAAMAVKENSTHIKFQNSSGIFSLINKNSIREMVDLGKPHKKGVV